MDHCLLVNLLSRHSPFLFCSPCLIDLSIHVFMHSLIYPYFSVSILFTYSDIYCVNAELLQLRSQQSHHKICQVFSLPNCSRGACDISHSQWCGYYCIALLFSYFLNLVRGSTHCCIILSLTMGPNQLNDFSYLLSIY